MHKYMLKILTKELLVVTMETSTDWFVKFNKVNVTISDNLVNCNYGNNNNNNTAHTAIQ